MDDIKNIPIGQVLEPKEILRLVNRDSIEYAEMRDSLRDHGFINSTSARPSTRHPGKYEIIDGLYRFTIAKELGFDAIPAIIKQATDDEVLALQIQANAIRPETTPVEFALQMRKLLTRRPDMMLVDLSRLIRKSTTWINNRLGLLALHRDLHKPVDRGEILLANAYLLAKLPPRRQLQYADDARSMLAKEFQPLVTQAIKRHREAVRQGKLDDFFTNDFKPQAHLRPLKMVQQEIDEKLVGALLVSADDCQTPLDGFYTALRWFCHLDRQSVVDQERAFHKRQRERTVNCQPVE